MKAAALLVPEVVAAALCVWVAGYHTPVGALVRQAAGHASNAMSSSAPVLAYFTPAAEVPLVAVSLRPSTNPLRGVREVAERHAGLPLEAMARRCAGGAEEDALSAAYACAQQLYGSDEAAVLAVFIGPTLTSHAVLRAQRMGQPLSVTALERALPPGLPEVSWAREALARSTAHSFGWPVSRDARITSPFGWRINPVTGRQQLHTGVDVAVPEGTALQAVADGVVLRVGYDDVNGRMVLIDHGHGVTSAMCHASAIDVSRGQRVTAGQVVAASGTTGRSTGPHVHYQVTLLGTPVDPLGFVQRPLASRR